MEIGELIKLTVRTGDSNALSKREFRVHSIYPKFVVLDSGKYLTTALKRDMEAGLPVRV